jgi:alanine racemase
MPVVKANAYGHGAVAVARAALQAGADRLAVNRVAEGVELRQAGLQVPILVMGYCGPWEVPELLAHNLTPTLTEIETAQALNAAAPHPWPVQLKIDTGMGRLGVLPHEALSFATALVNLPKLELEGAYTHFACADSPDPDDQAYTRWQFERFMVVLETLAAAGIRPPLRHAANSAATLYYPETHLDLVRVGIITYGLLPDANHPSPIPLRPALSIRSRVARLRTLPAGSSISYGRTYTAPHEIQVALIPVGYGDGYHRALSNRGAVLIRGQRAPIIGRVCMDQFMADVSNIPGVALGDEVVLLGRQAGEEISAEELGGWMGSINYEATTALLPRLPRVYKA